MLLRQVPDRARDAYTALVTDPESVYFEDAGWSSAFITQAKLAGSLSCSLRTAERAVSDLKQIGVVRVLAWPGARTETQVRVLDVELSSVFGPVRAALEKKNPHELVDVAIRVLHSEWNQMREEMGMD
jgi:hypothetical protein